MGFPYGKAPLAILLLALLSGAALAWVGGAPQRNGRPDLIYATFVPEHAAAYMPAIARFEKQYGVKVQLQVVDQKGLEGRLQSAMQVGADVPDMVELLYNTLGTFTRGPVDDVGFIDLTNKVQETGLREKLVASRFAKWSSRGHVFALPHDLHPVMLAYRSDLVKELGIDVNALTTWDAFAEAGRRLHADHPDRYMIDLASDGNDMLRLLMLQYGSDLVDSTGKVCFDNEVALNVICWYVKQIKGPTRIAFAASTAAGTGQTLAQAMIDGLCLFYICPDWRSKQFEVEIPNLAGKMSLMPLPAWQPGARRTSTWGGVGLAFTRECRNFDLAWKLAMYLYYDPTQLGKRYADTNILPPLKAAWTEPEFTAPQPYYGNLPVGRLYADLAPQVPQEQTSPYMNIATGKLSEAFINAAMYYEQHGDDGLRDYTRAELTRCANLVRKTIDRNAFMKTDTPVALGSGEAVR